MQCVVKLYSCQGKTSQIAFDRYRALNKIFLTQKAYRHVYGLILEVILLLVLTLYGGWDWSCVLGQHQWPDFKRKSKSTQDRLEKAISKTALDSTAGDNRGVFSGQRWMEGGGGFLSVLNKEENVVVFGDTSSHNPTETRITTQRRVNTSSAYRTYRGNDQK